MSNNQEIDNNEARQKEGGVLVEPPRVHNGEPAHHSGEKVLQLSILPEDQTSYYPLPRGYYLCYVDQPTDNYQEIYLTPTSELMLPAPLITPTSADFFSTSFDSTADDSYILASEDVFISTAAEVTSMASTAEDSLATSNAENSLIASAAVQDNVENVTATAAITPSDKTESADGRDGNDLKNDVATKLEATTAEEAAVEAAAMNEKQEITTTPGLLIEKKNVEMTKNIRKKYEELCNQLDLKADDDNVCLFMYHQQQSTTAEAILSSSSAVNVNLDEVESSSSSESDDDSSESYSSDSDDSDDDSSEFCSSESSGSEFGSSEFGCFESSGSGDDDGDAANNGCPVADGGAADDVPNDGEKDEKKYEEKDEEDYIVVEIDDCSAEDNDVLSITPSSHNSRCLVM
ncbi:hypothetical protein HELRODRAFT_177035 [Helobdella robusta]|uniref:Uncharacterized protein n=1 Tax=Helobdella robusta TaxID=6412 RepID=T1FB59_HELRO|nr:hypothetical protein HELRODRAFT_177035 [Helobdella robusta]ESN98556.1 hypothetical protein HELRODRAFT_177035 [Helobdella robusta]